MPSFDRQGDDPVNDPGDDTNRERERYGGDTETDPVIDAVLGGEPRKFGVDVASPVSTS